MAAPNGYLVDPHRWNGFVREQAVDCALRDESVGCRAISPYRFKMDLCGTTAFAHRAAHGQIRSTILTEGSAPGSAGLGSRLTCPSRAWFAATRPFGHAYYLFQRFGVRLTLRIVRATHTHRLLPPGYRRSKEQRASIGSCAKRISRRLEGMRETIRPYPSVRLRPPMAVAIEEAEMPARGAIQIGLDLGKFA